MSNLDLDTLHALTRLGVNFSIPIPGPGGQREHLVDMEDVLLFEKDPEKLHAKAHGLTVEQ